MKKGFVLGFIVATILVTGVVFANNLVSEVFFSNFPIKINGKEYKAEMPVLNYQGRTYLALREFGTVTGNEIDFKDNTIIINNNLDKTSNLTTSTTQASETKTFSDPDGIITISNFDIEESFGILELSYDIVLNKKYSGLTYTITFLDEDEKRICYGTGYMLNVNVGEKRTDSVMISSSKEYSKLDFSKLKHVRIQIDAKF